MSSSQDTAGSRHLRLALAQINVTVGDLAGNAERIIRDVRRAAREGIDVVAFPELALTGYPPEDLLLKPEFIADNLARAGAHRGGDGGAARRDGGGRLRGPRQ